MTRDRDSDDISALLRSLGIVPTARFKVLTFFLQQPSEEEFFLSQIARATKLTVTRVRGVAEELCEERMLIRKNRGRMKFYRVDNASLAAENLRETAKGFEKIARRGNRTQRKRGQRI